MTLAKSERETGEVALRPVEEGDLPILFEQQADPEANRMAAFPARDRDAFMAHWAKLMCDKTLVLQTILFAGRVAGNIVSWEHSGERMIGYWLGREYWGKGVASAALSQLLHRVTARPLVARVAKHNLGSIRVLQKCGFTISGDDRFPVADGTHGEEYIFTLTGTGELPQPPTPACSPSAEPLRDVMGVVAEMTGSAEERQLVEKDPVENAEPWAAKE